MNIARLNFSHGSYESHTRTVNNVREAARQAGKLIALALDTKGPEIRTGTRAGYVPGTPAIDIEYKQGSVVKVSVKPEDMNKCDETLMGVDYRNLPKVVDIGGKIFVDDGLCRPFFVCASTTKFTRCAFSKKQPLQFSLSMVIVKQGRSFVANGNH